MSAPLGELYIYYRIALADEAAVQQQVTAFQQTLRHRFSGLRARLLRRVDSPGQAADALLTMMEIYEAAADVSGQLNDLEALVAAIDSEAEVLAPLIRGERQLEIFAACA